MESRNPTGRGKGNLNKLTKESKKALFQAIKPEIEKLPHYFLCLPNNKKAEFLLNLLPFLVVKVNRADDEMVSAVQEIVFRGLEPHFKRIETYLRLMPSKDKAKALLGVISYFSPKQRKQIEKILEKNKKLS